VQARHAGVQVVEQPPSRHCTIQGDSQLLTQALLNLLINAIQAMPHGGTLTVSTDAVESGQCVIRVADTGAGMTAEVKRQIFHPFFTTKPEGEGTGLGLAITHRIVDMHNGVIRVDSDPGRGAVFEIELPLSEQKVEA